MVDFQPTHVLVGEPGYAHHVPVRPIPGLQDYPAVDGRGPLAVVTADGHDLHVVPAARVQPSVRTVVRRITDCDECADLLASGLEGNRMLHLATYFRMTSEGSR